MRRLAMHYGSLNRESKGKHNYASLLRSGTQTVPSIGDCPMFQKTW